MKKPASMRSRRIGFPSLALALVLAAGLVPCASRAGGTDELETRRSESRAEIDRITREITLSDERRAALEAEIAGIRKDNATLTAALIQAAKTEKKLAQDIEDIEERLAELREQEDVVRMSLQGRRGVLAEVLGALQRMGLNPPPAILVRPEDALSSVRSAILLGAVVPELRAETAMLLSDLRERSRLAATIESERGRLVATVGEQAAEKHRLTLLIDEKKRLQAQSETALEEEQKKAAELAEKANSLNELIASIETEIESVRRAVEEARKAEEERLRREAESAAKPVPEANRLLTTPFPTLQGKVLLPTAGQITRRFGDSDANGGHMLGDIVTTQSGAIVTAPADGEVLYAGPFRSYGQLLILNAGSGYHVVLAGMGRISVVLGQSVLAGEPVGVMGDTKVASTSMFGSANAGPELYIEFRKDGKPVDPAPWWVERYSGRTGNDT